MEENKTILYLLASHFTFQVQDFQLPGELIFNRPQKQFLVFNYFFVCVMQSTKIRTAFLSIVWVLGLTLLLCGGGSGDDALLLMQAQAHCLSPVLTKTGHLYFSRCLPGLRMTNADVPHWSEISHDSSVSSFSGKCCVSNYRVKKWRKWSPSCYSSSLSDFFFLVTLNSIQLVIRCWSVHQLIYQLFCFFNPPTHSTVTLWVLQRGPAHSTHFTQ